MPLTKAKALASIVDTCVVEYAGEQVHVTYYPLRVLALTSERAEQIQRDLEAAAAADASNDAPSASYALVAQLWSTYVAGWDVTEEEGGPAIPLDDGAALFELDPRFDLLLAILTACREAALASKPNGTASPAPTGASSEPAMPDRGSKSLAAPSRTGSKSRTSRSTPASLPTG